MPESKRKPNRLGIGWFLIVASVGLILRIFYILQTRTQDPLFYAPQMDALYHHQWAMAIANGMEFINDAYFRAPLYPFFLGLIYKIFSVHLFAVRLVQIIIGSLSCGLLYLVTRKLFRESTARIAGLILAFYPLAIYFDGELLIANLLIFLLLLGFWLLLRSRQINRQWYLPGLVFGLAAIARPNVLAFVVAIFIWLLFGFKERRWQRLVQFLVPILIIVAPVTIRNYVKSKRLVLIAWQAGTNFYIGNNPNSDGVTAIMPGTRGSWWGGYYDAKRLAEQAMGRPLKGADIDAYWLKQGFKFWQEQPFPAFKLLLRKVYLWFSGYEVSNDRDIYFFKHYSFLKFLIYRTGWLVFPFGILFPLSLVGIYLSRRKWRQFIPVYLFIISYTLSFVIFFVTARYRMPMVVLLIPFAVFGIESYLKSSSREKLIGGALFIVAFILFNLNFARIHETDKAQNHFLAALGFHETGRMGETVKELEPALANDSAVNILALEATVRLELGQNARAEKVAQAAVRLWPNMSDSYGVAGNVYAASSQPESAKIYFEHAVKLDPYSLQALNNLGNLALTRNDLPSARRYYEQALAIDPNFTLSLFHLGLVNYYEGKKVEAHKLWERVLQLDPKNYKAREALFRLQ